MEEPPIDMKRRRLLMMPMSLLYLWLIGLERNVLMAGRKEAPVGRRPFDDWFCIASRKQRA